MSVTCMIRRSDGVLMKGDEEIKKIWEKLEVCDE